MSNLSIYSEEFTTPIGEAINDGKELVVWHQISRAGGQQEWFLISRIEGLTEILKQSQVASAFTVFEWIPVPLSPNADLNWLGETRNVLANETCNRMLLLKPISPNPSTTIRLIWISEPDDLTNWFENNVGAEVQVGRIQSVSNGELIRGYMPDVKGIPQPGIY